MASAAGARPSVAAAADIEAPSEFCRRPDSTLCAPFMALANCDVLGVLSADRKPDAVRHSLAEMRFGAA